MSEEFEKKAEAIIEKTRAELAELIEKHGDELAGTGGEGIATICAVYSLLAQACARDNARFLAMIQSTCPRKVAMKFRDNILTQFRKAFVSSYNATRKSGG